MAFQKGAKISLRTTVTWMSAERQKPVTAEVPHFSSRVANRFRALRAPAAIPKKVLVDLNQSKGHTSVVLSKAFAR